MNVEAMLQLVGRSIRGERVKRGLSRDELADLADVSSKMVGKVERGETSDVEPYYRMATALDLTFSDLVREAEEAAEKLA